MLTRMHPVDRKATCKMCMAVVLDMLDDPELNRDGELLGMLDHVVTAARDLDC